MSVIFLHEHGVMGLLHNKMYIGTYTNTITDMKVKCHL